MTIDPWLPIGYELPDGTSVLGPIYSGDAWQILETPGRGRALVVTEGLASRWVEANLLDGGLLMSLRFGSGAYRAMTSGPSATLAPVNACRSPSSKNEALAFALSLHATRKVDGRSALNDGIYVERLSRLLPTYKTDSSIDDALLLGSWLSGGANISVMAFQRLSEMLSWLSPEHLRDVAEAAGLALGAQQEAGQGDSLDGAPGRPKSTTALDGSQPFVLPGRPAFEAFVNEHVVDIVRNAERYEALGINFPSAIILHGPPGCGKTFAVERLNEFLGWPSFQISSSSVGSPYIHETSRKIASVFDKAIATAPSVLVIDEMEAYLADREIGIGASHHRVEEVAEFLRRIPEAAGRRVLIIAMTNRLDMIDPAILRRGRFDHILEMGHATAPEIQTLLEAILADIPKAEDVDCGWLATRLTGRPLSDIAFVVREGARLAARAGRNALDFASLTAALDAAPARLGNAERKIGYNVR